MTFTKKVITAAVLGLAVIGGAFYFGLPLKQHAPEDEVTRTYASDRLGLSFEYPAYYHLEEKSLGNAEREHYAIILMEDTEENRQVREGQAPGREGPPTIEIHAYQNDLDSMTAEEWITNTSDSNYKLSDGELVPVMIGREEGFGYHWSGLYEADQAVVTRPAYAYSFAATFLTPDDRIRADFYDLIQVIRFEE